MKFIKGSLVSFREVRVNGLYLLKGSTLYLSGKDSVDQCLDSEMLWHRRLWHVSEKGLNEQSK